MENLAQSAGDVDHFRTGLLLVGKAGYSLLSEKLQPTRARSRWHQEFSLIARASVDNSSVNTIITGNYS